MRKEAFEKAVICCVLVVSVLSAQPVPEGQLAFEVASIKRAAPLGGPAKGEPEGRTSISGERLTMHNVSLKEIITTAFGIKAHQLAGPAWLNSDRYDVVATWATPTTTDQIRLMLQGLLADRFKLEIHRQTKDLAVAAMMPGKSRPKLGAVKPEGPSSIRIEQGKMIFQNYSMSKLADYLSQHSGGRPVVDATGIDGFYDFSVSLLDAPSDNPIDVKRAIGMGSRDGSLARTIADEIGLRLETRQGPVEIIVVDHAERFPSEN